MARSKRVMFSFSYQFELLFRSKLKPHQHGVGFVTGVEALAKRSRCSDINIQHGIPEIQFPYFVYQNHQDFMWSESGRRHTWRRRWNVEHHRHAWRISYWQDTNLPHYVRDLAVTFGSWRRKRESSCHRHWMSISTWKAETYRRTPWSRSSSSSRKCGVLQSVQHRHPN